MIFHLARWLHRRLCPHQWIDTFLTDSLGRDVWVCVNCGKERTRPE